jgi:hypothetical protein
MAWSTSTKGEITAYVVYFDAVKEEVLANY